MGFDEDTEFELRGARVWRLGIFGEIGLIPLVFGFEGYGVQDTGLRLSIV